jgi:chemotaxis protein MotA
MSFWSKLAGSILTSDWYILAAAVAAALCLAVVLWAQKRVESDLKKWEMEQNLRFTRHIYHMLTISYTLFITLISLFPLFGMFGTVSALLGLDLSSEAAISSAKNGFFDALTSTTWGIIFAVVFKIINAVFATNIENNIQKSGDLLKKLENLTDEQPPEDAPQEEKAAQAPSEEEDLPLPTAFAALRSLRR